MNVLVNVNVNVPETKTQVFGYVHVYEHEHVHVVISKVRLWGRFCRASLGGNPSLAQWSNHHRECSSHVNQQPWFAVARKRTLVGDSMREVEEYYENIDDRVDETRARHTG